MMPRRLHYFYSSILIPDMLFADPDAFFGRAITSDKGFARELWDMCIPILGINGQDADNGNGLASEYFSDGEILGIMFTMPHAIAQAETMAGCAIGILSTDGNISTPRYFTLERGENGTMEDAVFCEWRGKQHINYGELCAERGSFQSECIEMYKKLSAQRTEQ